MFRKMLAISVLGLLSAHTFALENGISAYPNGVENFMAAAVPPPGVYELLYATHYHADRLNDKNGDNLDIPNFDVTTNVIAARSVWVSEQKILGGNLNFNLLLPFVKLDADLMNQSVSKQGLGDISIGSAISFHHSPHFHSVGGFDVYLPTGDYDKNAIANIGSNTKSIDLMYAMSYIGENTIHADIKMGYLIYGKNGDTDYANADQFHFDYALGKNISNMTFGVGGGFSTQIDDDKQNGVTADNSKTTSFSLGPSFKYMGKNWFVTAKWQKELVAKNQSEGDQIWIKFAFPKLF